jgi:hypothetical protein
MVNYGTLKLIASSINNIASINYSGLTKLGAYYTVGGSPTTVFNYNPTTNLTTGISGGYLVNIVTADDDNSYSQSPNIIGSRSQVAFYNYNIYTKVNSTMCLSKGTFWNNSVALGSGVSNKCVIFWVYLNNAGLLGYLIFDKTSYTGNQYACAAPTDSCLYSNVIINTSLGGIFTSDDTYFYAGSGTILYYYYLNFSTTTVGGSTGPQLTYTFQYNIKNIIYSYALRVLFVFTSIGFYFFNPNNRNNTTFYKYPNNLTANFATAPSNMPLNNTNIYYYFIIDTNNILYQLPIYFNSFSNNYSIFPFIFQVKLAPLNITSVTELQCSYTGETLGITASNRMFIFQYTLPYIDSSIEDAVVW